jgi:putative transposase
MPWQECSAMDERLQFVARRLAGGGTLQGVRHFAQDRLQDLRSLSGMRHSGLTDRSRRPYRYANQLPFQVEKSANA